MSPYEALRKKLLGTEKMYEDKLKDVLYNQVHQMKKRLFLSKIGMRFLSSLTSLRNKVYLCFDRLSFSMIVTVNARPKLTFHKLFEAFECDVCAHWIPRGTDTTTHPCVIAWKVSEEKRREDQTALWGRGVRNDYYTFHKELHTLKVTHL
jgi:hypothetical protein